jgi:hypothetical protein
LRYWKPELEVKTDELRFKLYKLKDNLKNFILLSKHCKPNDKVGVIILELDSMFKSIDDSTAITLCTFINLKDLKLI